MRMGARTEIPVGSMISGNRLVQVVGTARIFGAIVLLRVVPHSRQVTVSQSGHQSVSKDGLDGGPTSVILAALGMVRSVIDGSSCHFRLKNGRNRLSFSRQSALYPAKLRRVESRHLDHGGFHFGVVVKDFGSQRGEET